MLRVYWSILLLFTLVLSTWFHINNNITATCLLLIIIIRVTIINDTKTCAWLMALLTTIMRCILQVRAQEQPLICLLTCNQVVKETPLVLIIKRKCCEGGVGGANYSKLFAFSNMLSVQTGQSHITYPIASVLLSQHKFFMSIVPFYGQMLGERIHRSTKNQWNEENYLISQRWCLFACQAAWLGFIRSRRLCDSTLKEYSRELLLIIYIHCVYHKAVFSMQGKRGGNQINEKNLPT